MRDVAKGSLALALLASPQARYDRTLLLLSHMRAATTALANVLCSHDSISGYGETHVDHRGSLSLARIMVNQAVRKAWSPRAPLLFDKVLHNALEANISDAFYRSRAIFMVRSPEHAIPSIQKLSVTSDLVETQSVDGAAQYYVDRLQALQRHWNRFPEAQRIGLRSEALFQDPEREIARLSDWLNLVPPMENRYASHSATQLHGGGDPTASSKLTKIQPRTTPQIGPPKDVSKTHWDSCETTYRDACKVFGI